MKEEDALKSITIHEAEAVNLEHRIGSIEEGKDADFVFLNGEPFEITTSVDEVIIDGKVEYVRNKIEKENYSQTSTPIASGQLNLPSDLEKSETFAIKTGTIFTMVDSPLQEGIILIKDGKIEKIGKNLSVPQDYPVIDAKNFVLMPGLVSARSHVGISANWRRQSSTDEASKPVVPELEVKHAIEPQAPNFSFSRELGITTAMITPGNRNVIGGQGTVLKNSGDVVDKMIVKDKAIMVIGLGKSAKRKNQMPSTRMGIAALLRETLTKATEYMEKVEMAKKEKNGKESKRDFSLEALIPVLKGEMPVMIHCERRDDILTALRIADEFKLKIIFDGATDAHKVVDEIKKRDIPVIVERVFRGIGSIEDKGFNPRSPSILAKAGVQIAFRPREGSWYTPGAGGAGGDLLEIAAFAVKHGMSEEAALRAITIDAAKIIGMDERIGSLEPGKDADILILRGHPFKIRSVPEAVFIDGKLVYQRKEGERIR
jgi:imidazolonepropionase-like amidohydrolase